MYSVSFDIDWVCDEVIQHCIDILDEYQVKAVFFATHTSPLISQLENLGHEVGLHPNLLPNLNGDSCAFEKTINDLHKEFPLASGMRAHCLITGSPIIQHLNKIGLSYDSSFYCPLDVPPFLDYERIVRIPFSFSDLQTVLDGSGFFYDKRSVKYRKNNIYAFHPIHVFLNTCDFSSYSKAKVHSNNWKELRTYRNDSNPGVETYLKSMLEAHQGKDFDLFRDICRTVC